jgi:hypothetical protein
VEAGYNVIAIDYRLAPESKLPDRFVHETDDETLVITGYRRMNMLGRVWTMGTAAPTSGTWGLGTSSTTQFRLLGA